ncbi:putative cytokinetic ring protein SteA [Peptostreptococcaceae bacterium AGR-M142]
MKYIIQKDKKTKDLAKRIRQGEVALINHKDIDEVAAYSLVNAKIAGIINIDSSMSGKYPNKGPKVLLDNGIFILDEVDKNAFDSIEDFDSIEIKGESIYKGDTLIAKGNILDKQILKIKKKECKENLSNELDNFIDNTLDYARKEKDFILSDANIPDLNIDFKNRQALVVVRGQNYKEDLSTIVSYISEVNPVLIGVDGGADALLEFGLTPDLIVGDMDSVSDEALKKSKEIMVHAYPNGKAPGLKRVEDLNLNCKVYPSPGTSEDIAMLVAYEKGAKLIVALGTHSHMIDFLEKGRKGMASTFLVRLKIGDKLVDAKGVSQLYHSNVKIKHIIGLIIAALFPVVIVASLSPPIQQLIKIVKIKMKLLMDF